MNNTETRNPNSSLALKAKFGEFAGVIKLIIDATTNEELSGSERANNLTALPLAGQVLGQAENWRHEIAIRGAKAEISEESINSLRDEFNKNVSPYLDVDTKMFTDVAIQQAIVKNIENAKSVAVTPYQ